MKTQKFSSLWLFIILLVSTTLAQQGERKRGITAEDYYAFETVSDPHLSPDGKLVAYVMTTIDQKQNRRNSSICLTATDGSRPPWQFTTSPQSSTSPRWSPDGQRLAFLSTRPAGSGTPSEAPKAQVYTLSMQGGEAHRVTNLKNGVSSFGWSPDGTQLVCLS